QHHTGYQANRGNDIERGQFYFQWFKVLLFKLLFLPCRLLVGLVSCGGGNGSGVFFLMKSTFKVRILLTLLIVDSAVDGLLFLVRGFLHKHFRRQRYNRDFLPDQPLYFLNVIFLGRTAESQCIAFGICPASTTNAV